MRKPGALFAMLLAVTLTLPACAGVTPFSSTLAELRTSSPARTARVVCDEADRTFVLTPNVIASPDGVHVSFLDSSGNVRFGETQVYSDSAPGDQEVRCSGEAEGGPPGGTIRVTDPEHLWIEDELVCAREGRNGIAGGVFTKFGQAPTARGRHGTPLVLSRADVRGLRKSERLLAVGYPRARNREVGVLGRNGLVAKVTYESAGNGRWLQGVSGVCPRSGLRFAIPRN